MMILNNLVHNERKFWLQLRTIGGATYNDKTVILL